jgi:hypothetical protein
LSTTHDLIQMAAGITEAMYDLDPDEPIDGALGQQIFSFIDGTTGKLEAIHHVLKRMSVEQTLLRQEVERLERRRKAIGKRELQVKGLAHDLLAAHEALTGNSSVVTPTFSAKLVANAGRVDVYVDAKDLDPIFTIEQRVLVPVKAKIKAALKQGATVPGARLVLSRRIKWS